MIPVGLSALAAEARPEKTSQEGGSVNGFVSESVSEEQVAKGPSEHIVRAACKMEHYIAQWQSKFKLFAGAMEIHRQHWKKMYIPGYPVYMAETR